MTDRFHPRQWPFNPSLVPHAHRVIAVAALLLPVATGLWSPAAAQGAACKPVPVMHTHTLPPYPAISQDLGESGTVTLQITIARNGHASGTKITHGSGFPRLDQAAESYVRQNYLWQPMACASAKTIVKVVWNLAAACARTKSCAPRMR